MLASNVCEEILNITLLKLITGIAQRNVIWISVVHAFIKVVRHVFDAWCTNQLGKTRG
jgi:hypothetical protein